MTNKNVLDAVQTMAEKEYIERGVLLTDEMTHTLPYSCGRSAGRVVVFVDDIEALPAADVVEVVRCKDCEHYQKGVCNHFGYYTYAPDVDEDDFCSHGERKEQK